MTATETAKAELNAAARQIARVAAGLFATQGYEATSVRMIVEAAGVAKPTLYYHFGSKEGLAQALLTLPMAVLADAMRTILEARGDPVEALVEIVEAHFVFCREDPDRARFFFALVFGPQGSELMVEIKQIDLPVELQRAMARQADAERLRRAKVISAEGEYQAAARLGEAAAVMEMRIMGP